MKKWKIRFSSEKPEYFPSENYLDSFLGKLSPFPHIIQFGYKKVVFNFPEPEFNEPIIRNYHNTRDFPFLDGTSRLGIHLRFGTISVRRAVLKASELNEVWLNELIWREFFMQLWRNNEDEFERWCSGRTGFLIIDAGIRELIETGYMHNRVRMIVANFLTKILLIDWQWGERFFANYLLDYELSSNNGNWQWASGTGADAAPYFRIFNPDEQLKKFDPDQLYVKKYLNSSSLNLNTKMVDYKECRERCLTFFKQGHLLR
jgi:deoxyribodipyrimidine photo-lyase